MGTAFLDVICPRSAERELVLRKGKNVRCILFLHFGGNATCVGRRGGSGPRRVYRLSGHCRPTSQRIAETRFPHTHKGKSHVANCKVLDLPRLRAATGSGKGWEPLQRTMRSRNPPRPRESDSTPGVGQKKAIPMAGSLCSLGKIHYYRATPY